MSKHTAGPWRVNKTKSHPWVVECKTQIPDIWNDVATVGYKPNASLIAAAPDLLEACKYALNGLAEIREGHFTLAEGTIKKLQQAIAKMEVE